MNGTLTLEKKKMKLAPLGGAACVPHLADEQNIQSERSFSLGEEEEIYEGYGRVKNAYPYRQRNGYSRRLEDGEVQTAVLENEHMRAVFLTEYGGRLWELWDKKERRNLLYTNDVLRFSNLAVRNAWFSGGVEWNLGVIGHTPFTTEKMYVAALEDETGNAILRMYEYERIRDVSYQMDFWLDPEAPKLNCRMRIVNENKDVVPMYWWSNMAVPEFEGGRVTIPAVSAYTCKDNLVHKVAIPEVRGVDVTDYNRIPRTVDYFFDLEEGLTKYIAHTDRQGYGLLHTSTARLRSRKLFCWGHQKASQHWQEFLTEQAGPYVEIQAGLAKTQYGCIPMAPNTAWEWLEQYGPLQMKEEEVQLSHESRSRKITEMLAAEERGRQMEELLQSSRKTALQKARLLEAGSGYGVLGTHGSHTSHLEFCDPKGHYSRWKEFLEGGKLHCPDPKKKPDVYLADPESFACLKEAVKRTEKKNWYAHYHLGLRYFIEGRYNKAERAFLKSLQCQKNAWAYHGLACTEEKLGRKDEAIRHMLKGMKRQKKRLSYIKEGFRILSLCEGWKEMLDWYEGMDEEMQANGRMRFYNILALARTRREEEAYNLMEADGGMVLDDNREGEDVLAELWSELYEAVHGTKGEVPYRYQYKAFE